MQRSHDFCLCLNRYFFPLKALKHMPKKTRVLLKSALVISIFIHVIEKLGNSLVFSLIKQERRKK